MKTIKWGTAILVLLLASCGDSPTVMDDVGHIEDSGEPVRDGGGDVRDEEDGGQVDSRVRSDGGAAEDGGPDSDAPIGRLAAFPTAEGYGAAETSGGRGGAVCHVTHRGDDGVGSLRGCIEDERRPLTIVFDVTGTITLTSGRIRNRQGDLTIAGQTAPGGGIQIQGTDSFGGSLLTVAEPGVSNVIVRYLKVRPNCSRGGNACRQASIGHYGAEHVIIDHVSVEYDGDQALNIYTRAGDRSADNTYSWNIAARGMAPHSTGSQISCNNHDDAHPACLDNVRSTFHHNLFTTHDHRMPRYLAGDPTSTPVIGHEFVNNVVFNWKSRAGEFSQGAVVDLINNYMIPGDRSSDRVWLFQSRSGPLRNQQSIFVQGTYVVSLFETPLDDNWTRPILTEDLDSGYGDPSLDHRRIRPLEDRPTIPVRTTTALEAFEAVLVSAGDSRGLDCEGHWRERRDSLDEAVIAAVREGRGSAPPENTEQHALPGLEPGEICPDSDGDGMPDAFENRVGLDENDGSDGSLDSGNGYTYLERYLNADL